MLFMIFGLFWHQEMHFNVIISVPSVFTQWQIKIY